MRSLAGQMLERCFDYISLVSSGSDFDVRDKSSLSNLIKLKPNFELSTIKDISNKVSKHKNTLTNNNRSLYRKHDTICSTSLHKNKPGQIGQS